MEFKDRLREARRAKGYTQRELADKIKSKNNTLSNWEKGVSRPTKPVIDALAYALGITPFDLFGDYTMGEVYALLKKDPSKLTPDEDMTVAFARPIFFNLDICMDDEEYVNDLSMSDVYQEIGDMTWEYRLHNGGKEVLFALDHLNHRGKNLVFEFFSSILSVPAYLEEGVEGINERRIKEFRNLAGLR